GRKKQFNQTDLEFDSFGALSPKEFSYFFKLVLTIIDALTQLWFQNRVDFLTSVRKIDTFIGS
ncbi:MAG: hypothetical protein J1E60_05060, partial [Christensenellaceae bacterium]|nr:hypothetical protein [Christensenellaceae bacterium]